MGQVSRKTTFIIGAGASHEFGLPTGEKLKEVIAQKLNILYDNEQGRYVSGDMEILAVFKNIARYNPDYTESAQIFQSQGWIIRDNMLQAPSIDNFLHTHRQNRPLVLAGKLAIAKSIMEAEKNSILFPKRNTYNEPVSYGEDVSKTWISQFFKILIAEKDFETFLDAMNNITFVSFNYDRCIQEFFCRAAKQYFVLDNMEVSRVIDALHIIYPYGTIGDYVWTNNESNFGEIKRVDKLYNSAQNIQTFTEGLGSNKDKGINQAITESDNIIFMGFGFLTLNMNYLFQNQNFTPKQILATAYKLSPNSIEYQKDKFKSLFFKSNISAAYLNKSLKVIDKTCSELIHEFNAYLSS